MEDNRLSIGGLLNGLNHVLHMTHDRPLNGLIHVVHQQSTHVVLQSGKAIGSHHQISQVGPFDKPLGALHHDPFAFLFENGLAEDCIQISLQTTSTIGLTVDGHRFTKRGIPASLKMLRDRSIEIVQQFRGDVPSDTVDARPVDRDRQRVLEHPSVKGQRQGAVTIIRHLDFHTQTLHYSEKSIINLTNIIREIFCKLVLQLCQYICRGRVEISRVVLAGHRLVRVADECTTLANSLDPEGGDHRG